MADIDRLLQDPDFRALPRERQELILKQALRGPSPAPPGASEPSDLTIEIGGPGPEAAPAAPLAPMPEPKPPPDFTGGISPWQALMGAARGEQRLPGQATRPETEAYQAANPVQDPPAPIDQVGALVGHLVTHPLQIGLILKSPSLGPLAYEIIKNFRPESGEKVTDQGYWARVQQGITHELRPIAQAFDTSVRAPGVLPATAMGAVSQAIPGAGYGNALARTALGSAGATAAEVARRGLTGEPVSPAQMGSDLGTNLVMQGLPEAGLSAVRAVTPMLPPVKLFRANQERAALSGQEARVGREIAQTEGEALQRGAAYQQEMDQLVGANLQQTTAMQDALTKYGQGVKDDIAALDKAQQASKESYGTMKLAMQQLGTNAQQRIRQIGVDRGILRGENVVEARDFLRTRDVPTEAEVKTLYQKVDAANGERVPQMVVDEVDAVRKNLAAKQERIRSFVPEASQKVSKGPQATASVPETAELQVSMGGKQGSLAKTPATELELQDFVRKPDPQGRWGINLRDEELFSELDALLGKAESGTSRLKNQKGFTSQSMAERAHEQGFIETPEVDALKSALDESVNMGRPVYSTLKEPPDFSYVGIVPEPAEVPRTFQGFREALTAVGQDIGALRDAVAGGAGPAAKRRLEAMNQYYAALQRGMDKAIDSGEMTGEARVLLREADAAYKIKATSEDLEQLIEKHISTQEGGGEILRPNTLIEALKDPANKPLVDKLKEIGTFDPLMQTLEGMQAKLAAPRDAVLQARELRDTARVLSQSLTPQERAVMQKYAETKAGMQARLAEQKRVIDEGVASRGQMTEAGEARLQAERKRMEIQSEARVGMLTDEQKALQTQRETIKDPLLRRFNTASGYGVPTVAGTALGYPGIGVGLDFAHLLARGLMTERGQRVVGRVLEATGGLNTAPATVALYRLLKPSGLAQTTQEFLGNYGKERK